MATTKITKREAMWAEALFGKYIPLNMTILGQVFYTVLSSREQIILHQRIVRKKTLREVAKLIPSKTKEGIVSHERVRQIEQKALRKLRLVAYGFVKEKRGELSINH